MDSPLESGNTRCQFYFSSILEFEPCYTGGEL